ncbi:transcriptional regulator, AraC family, partial [Hungatella hathewayi DSM 13479]
HALTAEIMRELEQREEYYEVSVRGLFLALLADLVRAVLQIAGPDEKKDDQPPENALVIAPALEYIRCHYMEDFSMEYLAGLCSLSPAHFRRLFSAVMETSPLKYLNVTRIRQAAVLLRTTEASVLSISEEVGYRSVSSFNRQFRDTMGQTPHEWRRRMSILKDQSVMKYRGFLVPETLTPDEP